LEKTRLNGDPFHHLVYVGKGGEDSSGILHVYLSGDGTPWIGRTRISADPTPRKPIALRLMALDRNPRLYLGRPCYEGFSSSTGCHPYFWTAGRYSEPVVASMVSALRHYIDDNGFEEVVLIGYSGGGVLAWLLAERVAEVRALVTIAANLDTDAWTSRHRYTPLHGSMNPAARRPLPDRIAQLHLVGSRDINVPPSLVRSALESARTQARVLTVASDHSCCWASHWPAVLDEIARLEAR
jgi:pimeloyl-ACP methyl ester carboxylesterase